MGQAKEDEMKLLVAILGSLLLLAVAAFCGVRFLGDIRTDRQGGSVYGLQDWLQRDRFGLLGRSVGFLVCERCAEMRCNMDGDRQRVAANTNKW